MSRAPEKSVRGRFAPSPTGPLHFGSLVAALASYLHAKSRDGEWLVRMEDLDPPREQPGAADQILRALEAHGLHWDDAVRYQSRRHHAYEASLERLRQKNLVYSCTCSRKDIGAAGEMTKLGPRYPGTCREHTGLRPDASIRVRTDERGIRFDDQCQGYISRRLLSEIGDFVIRRRDGLYAYQLAVVVDDADQGITEVVRGADLLDSTPRQIYLQQLLGLWTPAYLHIPVATSGLGHKLSKQTGSRPVDLARPVATLVDALAFLGQHPPAGLRDASVADVRSWALAHWAAAALPPKRMIPYDETPAASK